MKPFVLALTVQLTACGGVSVTEGLFSDAGRRDVSIGEPGTDAGDPIDAPVVDAAKDSPACASQPPVAVDKNSCGASGAWSAPAQFCELELGATGGYVVKDTPAACASWCTYTCACLIAAGVCSGTVASCTDMIGAVSAEAIACRP